MKKFNKEEFLKSEVGKDTVKLLHECEEGMKNKYPSGMHVLLGFSMLNMIFKEAYGINIYIGDSKDKNGEMFLFMKNKETGEIILSTKELQEKEKKYKKFVAEEFLETKLGECTKQLMFDMILSNKLFFPREVQSVLEIVIALKEIYGIDILFVVDKANNKCKMKNLKNNEILLEVGRDKL